MQVISFKFSDGNYHKELLGQLRGKVFHITSVDAYEKIKQDGFVFHNRDGQYPTNTGSVKSFGRNRGWVCLFDLRNKSEEEIEDALFRYYFVNPPWFSKNIGDFSESRLAYLILNPHCHDDLILQNEQLRGEIWSDSLRCTQFVPQVECWYDEKLSIECVQQVFLVTIRS